jgi:hypothetical protein
MAISEIKTCRTHVSTRYIGRCRSSRYARKERERNEGGIGSSKKILQKKLDGKRTLCWFSITLLKTQRLVVSSETIIVRLSMSLRQT